MAILSTLALNSLLLFSPQAELNNQINDLEPNLIASNTANCNTTSDDVFRGLMDVGLFTPNLVADLNPISLLEVINGDTELGGSSYLDYSLISNFGSQLVPEKKQTINLARMGLEIELDDNTLYNVLEFNTHLPYPLNQPQYERLAKVIIDYAPNCSDNSFPNLLVVESHNYSDNQPLLEIGIAKDNVFPIKQHDIDLWTDRNHDLNHYGNVYFGGDFESKFIGFRSAGFVVKPDSAVIAGRGSAMLKFGISDITKLLPLADTNILITPHFNNYHSYTVEMAAQAEIGTLGNFISSIAPFSLPTGADAQMYVSITKTFGIMTAAQLDVEIKNMAFGWDKLDQHLGLVVSEQLESLSEFGSGAITNVEDAAEILASLSIAPDLTPTGVDLETTVNIKELNFNFGFNYLDNGIETLGMGLGIEVSVCAKPYINLLFEKIILATGCTSQDFSENFNLL